MRAGTGCRSCGTEPLENARLRYCSGKVVERERRAEHCDDPVAAELVGAPSTACTRPGCLPLRGTRFSPRRFYATSRHWQFRVNKKIDTRAIAPTPLAEPPSRVELAL